MPSHARLEAGWMTRCIRAPNRRWFGLDVWMGPLGPLGPAGAGRPAARPPPESGRSCVPPPPRPSGMARIRRLPPKARAWGSAKCHSAKCQDGCARPAECGLTLVAGRAHPAALTVSWSRRRDQLTERHNAQLGNSARHPKTTYGEEVKTIAVSLLARLTLCRCLFPPLPLLGALSEPMPLGRHWRGLRSNPLGERQALSIWAFACLRRLVLRLPQVHLHEAVSHHLVRTWAAGR